MHQIATKKVGCNIDNLVDTGEHDLLDLHFVPSIVRYNTVLQARYTRLGSSVERTSGSDPTLISNEISFSGYYEEVGMGKG